MRTRTWSLTALTFAIMASSLTACATTPTPDDEMVIVSMTLRVGDSFQVTGCGGDWPLTPLGAAAPCYVRGGDWLNAIAIDDDQALLESASLRQNDLQQCPDGTRFSLPFDNIFNIRLVEAYWAGYQLEHDGRCPDKD